jgi:hypothetical protein
MWSLAYGDHEDRTLTHGYEATRQALCRHSLTAGAERREQGAKLRLIEKVRLDGGAPRPLESVIAGPPLPLRPP